MCDFYREDEILAAKATLLKSCDTTQYPSLQPFMRKRIGESKVERSIEDILSILTILDEHGMLSQLPTLCAASSSRVPVIPDEMSDLAAVRHKVATLRKQMTVLMESMAALRSQSVVPSVAAAVAPESLPHCSSIVAVNPSDSQLIVTNSADVHAGVSENGGTLESVSLSNNVNTSNFANILKRDLEDGFQLPKQHKKSKPKKQNIVIGGSNRVAAFRGVAQKTVVCVNRLKPSTSAETITDFLKSKGITVYTCFKVMPKGADEMNPPNFIGMRLCVPKAHADAILKTDLWPLGVTVRPWIFKNSTVLTPIAGSSNTDQ